MVKKLWKLGLLVVGSGKQGTKGEIKSNSRDSPGVFDDFQNNDEFDRKNSDLINSYYY